MPNAAKDNSRPRVDVFIPVRNDRLYLPRAISSVLGQEGVDVRVIVSDNASDDGTYECLLQAAANDARLIVHRNERDLGNIANFNRFADYVTAEYFMLLCSDDMLGDSGALRQATAVLEREPNIVTVYCDMVFIDGKDRPLARRPFRRTGLFDATATLHSSILSCRNQFGIPLLHRRTACMDLRYPDTLTYIGDIYFAVRAAERGGIFHISRPLIWNRYTGDNLTRKIVGESRRQFADLMGQLNMRLGPWSKAQYVLSSALIPPARRLFLRWAQWRSRNC